jgi:hypothetical protein
VLHHRRGQVQLRHRLEHRDPGSRAGPWAQARVPSKMVDVFSFRARTLGPRSRAERGNVERAFPNAGSDTLRTPPKRVALFVDSSETCATRARASTRRRWRSRPRCRPCRPGRSCW